MSSSHIVLPLKGEAYLETQWTGYDQGITGVNGEHFTMVLILSDS